MITLEGIVNFIFQYAPILLALILVYRVIKSVLDGFAQPRSGPNQTNPLETWVKDVLKEFSESDKTKASQPVLSPQPSLASRSSNSRPKPTISEPLPRAQRSGSAREVSAKTKTKRAVSKSQLRQGLIWHEVLKEPRSKHWSRHRR